MVADIPFFAPLFVLICLFAVELYLFDAAAAYYARPKWEKWIFLSFKVMEAIILVLAAVFFVKRPPLWLAPLWWKKMGLAWLLGWQILALALLYWRKLSTKNPAIRRQIMLPTGETVAIFWGKGPYRFVRYPEYTILMAMPWGILLYFNTLWPLLLLVPYTGVLLMWVFYLDTLTRPNLPAQMSRTARKIRLLIPFFL
jgi:protein-S-isoprenylcysteine O-methyltransferase Ste14